MYKAKLLKKKPKKKELFLDKHSENTIAKINMAIEALGLEYKRLDEVDIYNIFRFIKESSKG